MAVVPSLPDTERRTTYVIAVASAGPFDVGFDLYGDGEDYGAWLRVYLDDVELISPTEWTLTSPTGLLTALARPISDAQITLVTASTGTLEIVGQLRPRRSTQLTEGRGVGARDFNVLATKLMAIAREYYDRIAYAEAQIATEIADPTAATKAVRVDVVQTFTAAEQQQARANIGLRHLFSTLRRVTAAGAVTVSATTDDRVHVAKTAPAVTVVNLPTVAARVAANGNPIFIKNEQSNGALYYLTLTPSGTDTIEGASTYTMDSQRQGVWLWPDDTSSPDNWEIR